MLVVFAFMKNGFKIKSILSVNEKILLLSILEKYGCKNIYLHHAIYLNSERFTFILPDNFEISTPSFIAAYNKTNGELHFFSLNDEGVSRFNYFLYSTNNLLDIGKGIQYLGTDLVTSKKLFHYNTNVVSKLIEMNEYYVYTLSKEKFFEKKEELKRYLINEDGLNFCFATSKRDILKLLNLQKGYLYEEMQYPNIILSEKFIFMNLQKILKNYRLFFLEYKENPVAKCEWNAFSNKIFQIGGVYVDPKFRNRKLAFTLLYKMIDYSFSELDMKESSLFVRMSNIAAQKLYEKLFFEKYKENLVWAIFKLN
jgi:ribosomal protein S18 acetylase RimI-like enzyme